MARPLWFNVRLAYAHTHAYAETFKYFTCVHADMKFIETNYEAIEYHVLRTLIDNENGMKPGSALAGLDLECALEIFEMKDADTKASIPVSKDGKQVAFSVKDVDFSSLNGVHTWQLVKKAKTVGEDPISERKIKECISYLVSEGYLNYKPDKRFYITPRGIKLFLTYASMFKGFVDDGFHCPEMGQFDLQCSDAALAYRDLKRKAMLQED